MEAAKQNKKQNENKLPDWDAVLKSAESTPKPEVCHISWPAIIVTFKMSYKYYNNCIVQNNMVFKRKVGQLNLQEIEPEPEPVVPEPVKEEIPVPVKGTAKTHMIEGLEKMAHQVKRDL